MLSLHKLQKYHIMSQTYINHKKKKKTNQTNTSVQVQTIYTETKITGTFTTNITSENNIHNQYPWCKAHTHTHM